MTIRRKLGTAATAAITALTLATTLTACGSDSDQEASSPAAETDSAGDNTDSSDGDLAGLELMSGGDEYTVVALDDGRGSAITIDNLRQLESDRVTLVCYDIAYREINGGPSAIPSPELSIQPIINDTQLADPINPNRGAVIRVAYGTDDISAIGYDLLRTGPFPRSGERFSEVDGDTVSATNCVNAGTSDEPVDEDTTGYVVTTDLADYGTTEATPDADGWHFDI